MLTNKETMLNLPAFPALIKPSGAWHMAAFVLALALTFRSDLPALQEPIVARSAMAAALIGVMLLAKDHPGTAVLSACLAVQLGINSTVDKARVGGP